MGHREVRAVALDWQHPVEGEPYADGTPRYRPMHSRDRLRQMAQWNADHPDMIEEDSYGPDDYMPVLAEGTPYGYQLYETTTEGTPVSPVFTTLEDLAEWCAPHATVFASFRWTKEEWLASFKAGTTDADSLMGIGPDGMGPMGPEGTR
jgi:hypothetical protein